MDLYKRHFTADLVDSDGNYTFKDIEFEPRDFKLNDIKGNVLYEYKNFYVPKQWSDLAASILVSKYARKNGVPKDPSLLEKDKTFKNIPKWLQPVKPQNPDNLATGQETHAFQIFHRLAGCWTFHGWQNGYFHNGEQAAIYYDEMMYILAHQIAAPNSPQWFNTGLRWAYGITGPPQGSYRYSTEYGRAVQCEDAYTYPQAHACFINSIDDHLLGDAGIMDLWTREARIFKYGSGAGSNFSNIRGVGEKLSGGGSSSGLMSFLKIGDVAAGSIKSGGTTRRAAKMVVLDDDHPEILDFINWKVDEEQKVVSLVTGSNIVEEALQNIFDAINKYASDDTRFEIASNKDLACAVYEAQQKKVPDNYINRVIQLAREGFKEMKFETFDVDFNSKAYGTVSGQNSNNSVAITDKLIKLSQDPLNYYDLINRTDGKVHSTVKAADIWDSIVYSAWQCADPGLQYTTTINDWNELEAKGRIRASNPCSEYFSLDDTACNLASINLVKFLMQDNSFDLQSYIHAIQLLTVTLDITVTMAQLPYAKTAENVWKYRHLGLGYSNLGSLLMRKGIAYGSARALGFTGAITAIQTGYSALTSTVLSKELGSNYWEECKEASLRKLENHRAAALKSVGKKAQYQKLSKNPFTVDFDSELEDCAVDVWNRVVEDAKKHGTRNCQFTNIAPTGTIGMVMDCDTTGIEPSFNLVTYKTYAGGGGVEIVNRSVPIALKHLGYSQDQIHDILVHLMGWRYDSQSIVKKIYDVFDFAMPDVKMDDSDKDNELIEKYDKALRTGFSVYTSIATVVGLDKIHEKIVDPSNSIFSEMDRCVYGAKTLENNTPHLKNEHLSVFDCANKAPFGTRYISAIAHVHMMAVAQTFISSAISKTVNMPHDSTLKDVDFIYRLAGELSVKSIALYRDKSKLSQPLDSGETVLFEKAKEIAMNYIESSVQNSSTEKSLSYRRPLPQRRKGYTQKSKIGGHSVFLRTGEYEDGSLGEIFIDMHKEGATLRSMINSFAIAVSLGLQYGVPVERFVESFTFTRFGPNGMVAGHDRIKTCTSVIDYIFRELAISYLKRDDLSHVVLESSELSDVESNKVNFQNSDSTSTPLHVDGEVCDNCGNATMVRSGTCMRCTTCGHSGGCG